jgi:hypothetical protein
MSAILRCQAKNRFYESTQRLIQPRRVLWSFFIPSSFFVPILSVLVVLLSCDMSSATAAGPKASAKPSVAAARDMMVAERVIA